MTNHTRRQRPARPVAETFRALDGARVPGGCQHCDAYPRRRCQLQLASA